MSDMWCLDMYSWAEYFGLSVIQFFAPMADENKRTEPFLPIANISNVMKEVLPDGYKISKESKDLIQECVTELICFVTLDAHKYSKEHKRKTISGEDVISAVDGLGFNRFLGLLQTYHDVLDDKD